MAPIREVLKRSNRKRENENDYRYSYNGMEKDDEVSGNGNSYDYGARLYNPRIGRWMKRDQKEGKYPFSTPYSYAFNTPLFLKDYDGRDVIVTITSTDKAPTPEHPTGQTGHITLKYSTYEAVTLWVSNSNGEKMQQTFYRKTGTTFVENYPDQSRGGVIGGPALQINTNSSEIVVNSYIQYYRLDADEPFPQTSDENPPSSEWKIDHKLNEGDPKYDPTQQYYSQDQVQAELDIKARVDIIEDGLEPYKHYEIDPTTGNVDQNDCGSLVIDLLSSAGLIDETVGLRTYNVYGFVVKAYTPTHIAEDFDSKSEDNNGNPIQKTSVNQTNKLSSSAASEMVDAMIFDYIIRNAFHEFLRYVSGASSTQKGERRQEGSAPSFESK